MKKFIIDTVELPYPIRFLICRGDEYNLCTDCKARFCCYTGSVPYTDEFFNKNNKTFQKMMNMALFDIDHYVVEYDYKRHRKYYELDE